MNYFNEVENFIKKCEVNKITRRIEEENDKVITYWHIGRLIVEAQGGEKRAKYGNELIKEWSLKLSQKYGNGYDATNLRKFRQFYLLFQNCAAVRRVSWTNIKMLLKIKDNSKRNYYINIILNNNLSSRELEKKLKYNEYERLLNKPTSVELIIPSKKLEFRDNLKNPIILELNQNENVNNEHDLELLLIAKLKSFFTQLGDGFALVGNQYNIKGYYLDLLLFNINYNCYVVVELKIRELKTQDKAQIEHYMNLVDSNLKKEFHNKTLGIIISKKQDKFVAEFVGNDIIYPLTYELMQK